jgi:fatty acid desaturase
MLEAAYTILSLVFKPIFLLLFLRIVFFYNSSGLTVTFLASNKLPAAIARVLFIHAQHQGFEMEEGFEG